MSVIETISAHTERDLIRRAQEGETAAQEALLQQFYPLVLAVGRGMMLAHETARDRVQWEDLVQDGRIALFRAIMRFDLSRGHRLITLAHTVIRREMQRTVRNEGTIRVPVSAQQRGVAIPMPLCIDEMQSPNWTDGRTIGDTVTDGRDIHDEINRRVDLEDALAAVCTDPELYVVYERARGTSLRNIAFALGVSHQTVRTMAQRVRQKLIGYGWSFDQHENSALHNKHENSALYNQRKNSALHNKREETP